MTTNQQIIDTFLDVVKSKYADDVDIVLRYRPWFSTPAQDELHINLLIVPKPGRSVGFGLMHIVDGCRVQARSVTWEVIESVYATHHIGASVLGLSQLVYHAGEDSRRRYEELKSRITKNNTEAKITPEAIAAAEKHLQHAKRCFADLYINDNLLDAAKVLDTICDCMCKLNSANPGFGASNLLDELQGLAYLPDGFINVFTDIMQASPDIERSKILCKTLVGMVDSYIKACKHELFHVPPNEFLPGWYEMFLESWDAIITHYEKGDTMAVYLTAMQLQHWLTIIENNQGKALPDDLQLFHKFDASKMDEFIEFAQKSKQAFITLLGEHNVSITQVDSLKELRAVLCY